MKFEYKEDYNKSDGLIVTFPDEEEPKLGFEAIIAISCFSIVILLVILGTIVDRTDLLTKSDAPPPQSIDEDEDDEDAVVDHRRESEYVTQSKTKLGCFLSSFSIPRNFSRIFIDSFSMNKELKIFNGLFVVSFMMVLLNNIYFVSTMFGVVENARFSEYEHKFPGFLLLRLRFAYEFFYFCIGFTSCVKIWTNYYNNDKTKNVAFEMLRYAYRRFIPQAFLIFGTMFLFEFFGHGPLYQF
jgi:hypothetical protein